MIDRRARRRRCPEAPLRPRPWLALALGLLTVACGGGDAPPTAGEPRAPAPSVEPASSEAKPPGSAEPATQAPGVRADGEIVSAVAWFSGSLEQALARAAAEGKLVLVDVGAYWCPPCHRLDEEVFVRPEVGQRLAEGYVALRVDAEKGEGPELVERYHVQAYPTILVLEGSGVEKGRVVDFLPAPALLSALERIAAGGNVLTELAEAVEDDPDDLAKRQALAHAYLLAADAEAAKPELDAVLLGDPTDELGLASKVLYDRALLLTYTIERDREAALEQFRTLQRQFPDSKQAVPAYRQQARILCELGRTDEAIAALQAMVATNPEDPGLAASFGWLAFRERCAVEPGLEAVRKGIALAPDDADLRYVEAELLHLRGRDAEALESIRRASALEPKSAFYRRQVARFTALQAGAGGGQGE